MASILLDQVKFTANILVPLLRAFREEFGAERTNQVAWKALEKFRHAFIREAAKAIPSNETPVDRFRIFNQAMDPAIGDAVDWKWLKGEAFVKGGEKGAIEDKVEFDITGCRFAQVFRELNEPELGFLLLCSMDFTAAEDIGQGEVKFTRTRTIMQGADHCNFRYELKKQGLM